MTLYKRFQEDVEEYQDCEQCESRCTPLEEKEELVKQSYLNSIDCMIDRMEMMAEDCYKNSFEKCGNNYDMELGLLLKQHNLIENHCKDCNGTGHSYTFNLQEGQEPDPCMSCKKPCK